jgi:hypothetical protein
MFERKITAAEFNMFKKDTQYFLDSMKQKLHEVSGRRFADNTGLIQSMKEDLIYKQKTINQLNQTVKDQATQLNAVVEAINRLHEFLDIKVVEVSASPAKIKLLYN